MHKNNYLFVAMGAKGAYYYSEWKNIWTYKVIRLPFGLNECYEELI